MKTIERAHTPKNMWEKIKLPADYIKAFEIVSTQLEHFPKYLNHRNKQRLTKIHQMLIRMRKLKLNANKKYVPIDTKVEQRDKRREAKALKAAQLEKAIEKELLERLKQSTEEGIFNYPERQFNSVLNKASNKYKEDNDDEIEDPDEVSEEEEEELEEELEEEEEEEEDGELNIQYVEDFEESDEDIEDTGYQLPSIGKISNDYYSAKLETSSKKRKLDSKANKKDKKRKGTRVEVEYEDEDEEVNKPQTATNMDFNF